MNPGIEHLQPYPFERLTALRKGVQPNADYSPIALHIGEPKHEVPAFALEILQRYQREYGNYPASRGLPELRRAIADWLIRRFDLPHAWVDPDRHVLPVSGTREALFAFAQFIIDRATPGLVVMPNPFYQIYEGAALLAGAEPYFLNCTEENGFLPDVEAVPPSVWERTQLLYLCTPGNPTGTVASLGYLKRLIELSDKYGFVIASDECYSEIFPREDAPPPGLLQACREVGRDDFRNCVVFHSLSKRSNLPGLRTGFVAGDAELMKKFLLYRTYHGCAMPLPVQRASIAAWNDEEHVRNNRDLYRAKFAAVRPLLEGVLEAPAPDAAFYLWAKTPVDDEQFSLALFRDYNVSVLPGSYLSREAHGFVPGKNRIRISLVATVDECVEAAKRIRALVERG